MTPEERAWEVLSRAFEERTPHPRARRRPTLAVALAALAVGLALVTAGLSASQSVRRALGVEHAAVALVRLPTTGRLLYVDPQGRVRLVDADSRKTLWTTRAASQPLTVAWMPGGHTAVELTARSLRIFHARDGTLFKSIPLPAGEHRLALSPTGPAA